MGLSECVIVVSGSTHQNKQLLILVPRAFSLPPPSPRKNANANAKEKEKNVGDRKGGVVVIRLCMQAKGVHSSGL